MALQFIFGLIVLRWETGRQVFKCLGDKITTFLNFTNAGSGFVYGYQVTGSVETSTVSGVVFKVVLGSVFAFQVRPHFLDKCDTCSFVSFDLGFVCDIFLQFLHQHSLLLRNDAMDRAKTRLVTTDFSRHYSC